MDRTKNQGVKVQPENTASNGDTSWPAWYYGPDGKAEIFQSEDEVPAGWTDNPATVGKGASKSSDGSDAAGSDIADDDTLLKQVMDDNTADDLVTMLEAAQEDEDREGEDVEFLKSWPKLKLAKAVIAYDLIEVTETED